MAGATWRTGMATRCGACLSKELDFRDDGSSVCRACGSVTLAHEARPKAPPPAAEPSEGPAAAWGIEEPSPFGPAPLAGPPPGAPRKGPSAAVIGRSYTLLWAAVLFHGLAAIIPLVLLGGVAGPLLWFFAVGFAAQVAFAVAAALGALWLLRSFETFATPMIVVGLVALLFSAVFYGGVIGAVGGALTMWAWWNVRSKRG